MRARDPQPLPRNVPPSSGGGGGFPSFPQGGRPRPSAKAGARPRPQYPLKAGEVLGPDGTGGRLRLLTLSGQHPASPTAAAPPRPSSRRPGRKRR